MSTIINNPSSGSNEGGMGMGVIIGIIIVVLLLVVAFLVYGMPALQGNKSDDNAGTINVGGDISVPTGGEDSSGGASTGGGY